MHVENSEFKNIMNYYNIKQWRRVRMKWIKRKSCTNTWNCPKQVQVLGLKCCWDLCSLIPHDRIHRMWKMLEKIIKKSNKTQSCSWCNKTFFSGKKTECREKWSNIIPASDVKMRWIVKVILRNSKMQFMWRRLNLECHNMHRMSKRFLTWITPYAGTCSEC